MSVFGIDIDPSVVRVFKPGVSKREALDILVDAIADTGVVRDHEAFHRAVHDREDVVSTGIGSGVAIPHVRMEGIRKPMVGVGISPEGVDFDSLDNELVKLVVLFAMPAGSKNEYLGLLAQVMLALRAPEFRDRITACKSAAEVVEILNGG